MMAGLIHLIFKDLQTQVVQNHFALAIFYFLFFPPNLSHTFQSFIFLRSRFSMM